MAKKFSILTRYPILTLAIVAMVLVGLLSLAGLYTPSLQTGAKWVAITTVLIVIFFTTIDMLRSIMRGNFGLDILALVAMVATLAVGEYVAGLIIVLMLSGGEALEDYAQRRASHELTHLLDRRPQTAHLLITNDSEPEISDIPVDEVCIGDELIVRPGEVVPVDGTLLSQEGEFDESSLTGESLPVTRQAGEELLSGILNGQQAIRMRAIKLSTDSQYQQIVKLVQQAQASQAPVVRVADRFAIPFTVVSLLIAGLAWALSGDPVRFAQVLVLATPCPLLIAAPVAFLGGLSRAAKAGIVIKGGSVVEQLARIKSVAFDKTGTLTRGEAELQSIAPHPDFTENELLLLIASAEQYSSHVLADGIRKAAESRGLQLPAATAAREEATNGVVATIEGKEVVVGKYQFVKKFAKDTVRFPVASGEMVAYVAVDGVAAGSIVLADRVRKHSASVIEWLSDNGVTNMALVTGDAAATAAAVAQSLNLSSVHAELMPNDKVKIVKELLPKPTLMVGDGINDAPVLAAADVGIAMAARGATAAGEAADVVILKDSIARVADAVNISKHTLNVALQAIWIGIILSVGLMLVATTGLIPAVAGALIQEIVDLVAILYALRTLKGKNLRLAPVQSHPAKTESEVALSVSKDGAS